MGPMSLVEYMLLTFSSLLAIIDPIAAVPTFLAMTRGNSQAERTRMALVACTVATVVLVSFATVGQFVFRLLGITMPAFQMAGSILLMLVALDMLRGRQTELKETAEETAAGVAK